MEFELTQPIENQLTEIDFNYLQLKTQITNSLEKYRNVVYTDELIKQAKADKATLNAFKNSLDNKRKEIKKAWNVPYVTFETKVKELVSLVDDVILPIDTQVKAFEDKKAQEKREELEEYFNDLADSFIKQITSFEKIFNPKWLNATYAIKKAKEDIHSLLKKIVAEIDTINDLQIPQDIRLQVHSKYLETLSLTEALAEKTKLEALKSNLTTIENKTNETIKEDVKPVLNDNVPTYKVVFEVEATKEQLQMIKRFLQDNKIAYKGNEDSEKLKKAVEALKYYADSKLPDNLFVKEKLSGSAIYTDNFAYKGEFNQVMFSVLYDNQTAKNVLEQIENKIKYGYPKEKENKESEN